MLEFLFLQCKLTTKLKVFIVSHRQCWKPRDCYELIWVGPNAQAFKGENDFVDSAESVNISQKNRNFCELTALYWLWKNLAKDLDTGLVHYRRFFGKWGVLYPQGRVFKAVDYERLLSQAPIIVPTKRNYYVETVWSQYAHAHHEKDLMVLRGVLVEKYPDYLDAFDSHMKGRKTHLYNMFVMRRPYFDSYCSWLFDILFEVERRLDISQYSQNDQRVFGFLGERLLDVWLLKNKIPYVEAPVVFLGHQNWFKKGFNFLARKYGFKTID